MSDRPKGKLVTGAVGSVFFLLAWAVFFTMLTAIISAVQTGSKLNVDTVGGMLLVSAALMIFGGILQSTGFFALRTIYGGNLHLAAGLFSQGISFGILLPVIGAVLGSVEVAVAGVYLLYVSIMLQAITAGVAFLKTRADASKGQGALLIGGIAFLASGVAFLIIFVTAKAEINIGSGVGNALGWLWVGGNVIGHLLATVVMLGQRSE